MRIALAGSGGTGKTVTSHEIARLMRWPRLESKARKVFADLNAKSMETDPTQDPEKFLLVQERILEEQIKTETEASRDHDNWVSERTVLDTAAYAFFWAAAMPVAAGGIWARHHLSIKDRAMNIVNRAQQHAVADPYDRVFIMPYGRFPLAGDAFRHGDAGYQRAIDIMITGLIFKKLADRASHVPLLQVDEVGTALWIIENAGTKPVIPREEWHKSIDKASRVQAQAIESEAVKARFCKVEGCRGIVEGDRCTKCLTRQ